MEYFVWRQDWNYPEVADIHIPSGWSQSTVCQGERIAKNLQPLHIVISKKQLLTDALVNRGGWLVFSPKLQSVISNLTGDPIQYLDVVITKGPKGSQIPGYKLCNPLVSLEAIDKNRSSFRYFDDSQDILGVNRLILDEKRVGNHSLFRLRELVSPLFVREDLAEGIRRSSCTGVAFMPIEQLR